MHSHPGCYVILITSVIYLVFFYFFSGLYFDKFEKEIADSIHSLKVEVRKPNFKYTFPNRDNITDDWNLVTAFKCKSKNAIWEQDDTWELGTWEISGSILGQCRDDFLFASAQLNEYGIPYVPEIPYCNPFKDPYWKYSGAFKNGSDFWLNGLRYGFYIYYHFNTDFNRTLCSIENINVTIFYPKNGIDSKELFLEKDIDRMRETLNHESIQCKIIKNKFDLVVDTPSCFWTA
jgi:hypothetical protein